MTVTGCILAGGDSSRMGRDKATLPWRGNDLLHHVHQIVAPLCDATVAVTRPGRSLALPTGCRLLHDQLPGRGPLVGIQAALAGATTPRCLVVACDMPWLSSALLAAMLGEGRADVVIPRTQRGWEPLHAIYDRRCLPAVTAALARGDRAVASFFTEASVEIWDEARCRRHDPQLRSFMNLNHPADLTESG